MSCIASTGAISAHFFIEECYVGMCFDFKLEKNDTSFPVDLRLYGWGLSLFCQKIELAGLDWGLGTVIFS